MIATVEPLRLGDGVSPYVDLPRLAPSSKATLSTPELTRLTGATYRQIDYWCSNALIDCEGGNGSGNKRAFDPGVVPVVSLLVRVSKTLPRESGARVSLALLEEVRDAFDAGCAELGHGIRLCWDEEPINQPTERNTT